MSRLAAVKEFTFMKALREAGFSVPEPLAQSRHTIVMSLIDAFPLRQISEVPDPAGLYAELIEMILRLASFGLIHGDFNEFNILVKEEKSSESFQDRSVENDGPPPKKTEPHNPPTVLTPVLIDFPQMVSIDHPNAAMYFDRDVKCVKRFFSRRFHFISDEPGPFFSDARKQLGKAGAVRLDVNAEASGFSKKMARELEEYMELVGVGVDGNADAKSEGDEDIGEDLEIGEKIVSDRVRNDQR